MDAGVGEPEGLSLWLVTGSDIRSQVVIIGNLSDLADGKAGRVTTERFARIRVKDQNAAVDGVGVCWIGGLPVAEPLSVVAGLEVAPYDNTAAGRVRSQGVAGR